MNVAALAIIMAMAIPIVAIVCGTIAALVNKRSSTNEDPEQTRMIQEIYHGLERMEQRIEALETILFDASKKEHRP